MGPVTETLPEICALDESLRSHASVHAFSVREPERFWAAAARARLHWARDFDSVARDDMAAGRFEWFGGGRLNATVSCVDRHAASTPDKVALVWERDEPATHQLVTYKQLLALVCRAAGALRATGVRRGERVVVYMPVSPLAVAVMLGCVRLGVVHSVVFAGFSADALATRVVDAGARVVVTADQAVRGGRTIELKATVDEALLKCPAVERVLVMRRTGAVVSMDAQRDVMLDELMDEQPDFCEAEIVESEDPLFMLYTSGSTGKPKGIVHSTAGYLLYAALTHKLVFDYREGDVFACVADIGWITGHSYVVYGPLANGATTVLFESVPVYPNPGRYWEMVERLRVNQFYGAPTAIRLLLRYGDSWPRKFDRSSLRLLGSVGEPINHEAWQWYHDVVGEGRCTLVDTWWQTETGGVCLAPSPAEPGAEVRPAMAMRPFYGIRPVLLGDDGAPQPERGGQGALCLAGAWPGIARTVYGDHERFVDTYLRPYPGYYLTGDGALTDADGYWAITGRVDDVINVSGHRLGTAEVEDVLDEHADVAEAAVVSFEHEVKGAGIYAFVSLKEGVARTDAQIAAELRAAVRRAIAAYAVPDRVLVTDALPKTRSGKIMRRVLRKIAAGQTDDLGDVSTLAEPHVVGAIVAKARALRPA